MAFEREKDDFWDLTKILPKKRPLNKFATDNPISDYEVDGDEIITDSSDRAINYVNNSEMCDNEEVYIPTWSSLIKKVTVRKKTDKYDFYDSFRKSAILYFEVQGEPCDFVQFYSYIPQYSQLRDSQKSYYFYWRSEMRRGRYIKTDYSYLYLAVYEIINLPDLIPPSQGLVMLTDLWREYRCALPRIDFYFSIWVQDYCLIHKLPCPTDALSDFIFDILPSSPLREFYITDISSGGERGLLTLLAHLSSYDYRKGKFVGGNPDASEDRRKRQAELYRAHMNGAMLELFKKNVQDTLLTNGADNVREIVRDSFPNSLSTHTVKSQLRVEYYSISDNPVITEKVTAAVRYSENRLRALIGIKSRLSVKGLPDEYKQTLDAYFDALDAREREIRSKENVPEYEKLYSAPTEKLSVESADKIESVSWMTTARLVESSDEYSDSELKENLDVDNICADVEKLTVNSESDVLSSMGLYKSDVAFIALLAGKYKPCFGDLPNGAIQDEAKDRINEAFYDSFGDILIEEFDGEYKIIEDYLEDAIEWLLKIQE